MPKNEQPTSAGHQVRHHQVKVYCPFMKETIEVDEGIAPLLEGLWNLDIYTIMSCEDNIDDRVWIEFESSDDVEEFLRWISNCVEGHDEAPTDLMERIAGYHFKNDGTFDEKNWDYDVVVNDLSDIADGKDADHSPSDFAVSISVRFPRSDYEFVRCAIESGVISQLDPYPPEDRDINGSFEPEVQQ